MTFPTTYAPDVSSRRGDELARRLERFAMFRGARGFTIIDLIRPAAACGATLGELVGWVADARGTGMLEDAGFIPDIDGRGRYSRRYRVSGVDE